MMSSLLQSMFVTVVASDGEMDAMTRAHLRAPAATEAAKSSDDMYMFLWWFGVAWFVFLMGIMMYWVIKYRRRPGKIAEKSSSHNTPLEIAWTVIPTIMLVFIFFKGFWGYLDKLISPGHAVEMRLIAFKWNWSLFYPNGEESTDTTRIGARDIPVFYMPAETPIRLRMNSNDVMHAFYVPDFRVKQDILPNRYTTMWFEAKAPSGNKKHAMTPETAGPDAPYQKALAGEPFEEHWVFCAEYCGDEHSEMAAVIRVVSDAAYKRWLEEGAPVKPPAELGQAVWKNRCASCHTVDGGTNTGPTWKDLWGSTSQTNVGPVKVDADYVRESILVPSAKIVKGFEGQQMTSFQGILNEKQIDAVIAYMKTISVHATPAEVEAAKTLPAAAPVEKK